MPSQTTLGSDPMPQRTYFVTSLHGFMMQTKWIFLFMTTWMRLYLPVNTYLINIQFCLEHSAPGIYAWATNANKIAYYVIPIFGINSPIIFAFTSYYSASLYTTHTHCVWLAITWKHLYNSGDIPHDIEVYTIHTPL